MANLSSYVGANASTKILFGTLDNAHSSTISGYWVNYPTPWPYLLISLAISIGLGWLGYRSSAQSWHPVPKRGRRRVPLEQSDMEMPVPHNDDVAPPLDSSSQPQVDPAKQNIGLSPYKTGREERAKLLVDKKRHFLFGHKGDKEFELTADSQAWDPAYDIRPDGGMGKFFMYKAIFGIAWTSLRSISIFALSIKIALGSDSSHAAYPDPLSLMILFTSAQTYLAGRGMPRFFNVILAYDLVLIWIAFVLCSFGSGSTARYYGKIGIQGGNCPYFDRPKYLSGNQCASGRWTQVGCSTNSTWDTSAHDYPRAAWWFTGDPDPNTYGNSLLTFQLDFKLIGIVYGLITLFLALPFYFLPLPLLLLRPNTSTLHSPPRPARQIPLLRPNTSTLLSTPLPALKFPFLRTIAHTTSLASFLLVLILSIIAIPLHISAELNPPSFPYVDSRGPVVDASVFNGDKARMAVHGRWPSEAWNQSHGGGGNPTAAGAGQFLGGNESIWSDCFWVQPPKSSTGHLRDWWIVAEGKALRVLAGV